MNKNKNTGRLRTSPQSISRYVSSKEANDNKRLVVMAIALVILLLAIVILLFAMLSPDGLLAWNPFGDSGDANTTPSTIQKPTDPNKDYPYGTTPEGNKFVADKGGEWLSGLDSKNAILVRLSDMTTIGYKGADESIYPASMTKLMTVITALDLIENLDDIYTYKPDVFDRVVTDVEQRQDLKYNASTSDMQYIYTEYYGDDRRSLASARQSHLRCSVICREGCSCCSILGNSSNNFILPTIFDKCNKKILPKYFYKR